MKQSTIKPTRDPRPALRKNRVSAKGAGRIRRRALLAGVFLSAGMLLSAPPAQAQDESPSARADEGSTPDLTAMSLESLMDIEVTTVTRSPQKLSDSAAAIYVITGEDIRRTGALSIAEALRMVPGLNVARSDSSRWAISSRGFNDILANKLLVLMDGRSVYTPLFSGIFWDAQDTFLEDIDRIEVIRGPGGSLWGANAVNGVINVITKSAAQTQGATLIGGAGTQERGFGGFRYGGKFSEDAHFRVYVKYSDRDNTEDALGNDAGDDWQVLRTGFRTDWKVSDNNALTLQGDYYDGTVGQRVPVDILNAAAGSIDGDALVSGGNVLGRWSHDFSAESNLELQVYYDRTERFEAIHRELRNTFDIDSQHRFAVGERQTFLWGAGYRYTEDELEAGQYALSSLAFTPRERQDSLFSAFLQDEIQVVEDRLRLTLGSKFEHNDYSGFEYQPSGRLAWTPHDQHTLWGAVSRAVRTPSRFEQTIQSAPALPLVLLRNEDFDSEEVAAYELGYRWSPARRFSLDVAGFYNEYDDLRGIEVVGIQPPGIPMFRFGNVLEGETFGVETSADVKLTDFWKISAGYSWLNVQLHEKGPVVPNAPGFNDTAEGDSPDHQFHARSYLDLPHHFQFDTAAYYVDNVRNRGIPGYLRWDARVGWSPNDHFDISVVVQNLLDNSHPEFGGSLFSAASEMQRSVYAKLTWRF